MQTIGVRDLKARLSQVLREVQRGETILVTDRGRVVAELRAPSGSLSPKTAVERAIANLAAGGALRVAEATPDPYPASPLSAPDGTASELLRAERDEG
jgi:antitoxin (DNA-binding transcriptional repressor) of toxin-antitoxin stability system